MCPQCADPRRDDSLLCVVEGPLDVFAVEQTGYRGRYFVLKGHLSPLDGLGPEAIGIPELEARIRDGAFSEVILATNPTVEGEATAHYIAQLLAGRGLTLSRIAHGVPLVASWSWSMAAPWPTPWPDGGRSPELCASRVRRKGGLYALADGQFPVLKTKQALGKF